MIGADDSSSHLIHGEELVFLGLIQFQTLVEHFNLLDGGERGPLVAGGHAVQSGQDLLDPLQVDSAEGEDLSLFTSDLPEKEQVNRLQFSKIPIIFAIKTRPNFVPAPSNKLKSKQTFRTPSLALQLHVPPQDGLLQGDETLLSVEFLLLHGSDVILPSDPGADGWRGPR